MERKVETGMGRGGGERTRGGEECEEEDRGGVSSSTRKKNHRLAQLEININVMLHESEWKQPRFTQSESASREHCL